MFSLALSTFSFVPNFLDIFSQKNPHPIFVIDKVTKEMILSSDPRFQDFFKKTHCEGTNQCLGLYPTEKKDHFLIKGVHTIENGVVKNIEKSTELELGLRYCSNYVLVPNEPFLRIDLRPTKVDQKELDQKDDGKWQEYTTRVEMSHRDMSKDLTNAECAGEIRYVAKEKTEDGGYLVQILGTNLQSSVYDYPDYPIGLEAIERLGFRKVLYRSNPFEVKGREKRLKK